MCEFNEVIKLIELVLRLLDISIWPVFTLSLIVIFKEDLRRLLRKSSQIKLGTNGIELILANIPSKVASELNLEILHGLTPHDIWALKSISDGEFPKLNSLLTPPQKVAIKVLSNARLVTYQNSEKVCTVKLTDAGRAILSSADSVL